MLHVNDVEQEQRAEAKVPFRYRMRPEDCDLDQRARGQDGSLDRAAANDPVRRGR
jgi:hypothetical protein